MRFREAVVGRHDRIGPRRTVRKTRFTDSSGRIIDPAQRRLRLGAGSPPYRRQRGEKKRIFLTIRHRLSIIFLSPVGA